LRRFSSGSFSGSYHHHWGGVKVLTDDDRNLNHLFLFELLRRFSLDLKLWHPTLWCGLANYDRMVVARKQVHLWRFFSSI
jgi:hypothetical protein